MFHEFGHLIVSRNLGKESMVFFNFVDMAKGIDISSIGGFLDSLIESNMTPGYVVMESGSSTLDTTIIGFMGGFFGMLLSGFLWIIGGRARELELCIVASFFFIHQLIYMFLEPLYLVGSVSVNVASMVPMFGAFIFLMWYVSALKGNW
jgi:hypothetical protein